ncbi:hypothetical protein [Novosphingobium colocasiae]|uniref:hypothetical protein n=1 Tax=Novosphingobium colocasiae TaxID=1256513 RepID=UPI0035B2E77A
MKSFHLAAALAAVLPAPAFACASCGCTFTSDWLSQGLVTQPGQAVTIRYDYIPQTDLRTGTGKVDAADLDLPNEREIERSTYNHIATLAYDRQFADDLGFNLAVPWISRPHRTIAEDTVAVTSSTGAGIGDVRLVGRWQGLSTPKGITGLQLGVVLPTGSTEKRFASGPEAGEEIDRGLQPGTGTVQAIVGAYHYSTIGPSLALVLQGQVQFALHGHDGFRPGTLGEASASLRYLGWQAVTPELQINGRINGRDKGVQADRTNSGGEQVYLSPGASVKLTSSLSAFGLVQVPLYQRVKGWQLTPKVIASTGLQMRF